MTPRHRVDEAGSTLITAVIVMVVLTTLSLAGAARMMSSLQSVRHGQDFDAALAVADAALAEAIHEIDAGATPRVARPSFERSGSIADDTYRYTVLKRSEASYDVYAVGEGGRSKHGITPSAEQATRATCASVQRLRPALFNGSADAAAIRQSLAELRSAAGAADPAVASAVDDLASAPELGGPELLRALTAADEACADGGDARR